MKEFYRHYLPYIKNYKLKFFFAVIGMIMVAGGTAGSVYIIEPLLDNIFINKNEDLLYIMPFIVVGIYTVKALGTYIQKYYISYIGQDIVRIIRDKLLRHILSLDMSFFNKKHGGELISRITNDINRIQMAVSNYVSDMIRELLTIVGLISVAIYQSAELAFYGLIVLPLALIPLSKLAKKMKKISFRSQESISDITSNLIRLLRSLVRLMNTPTQPMLHFILQMSFCQPVVFLLNKLSYRSLILLGCECMLKRKIISKYRL